MYLWIGGDIVPTEDNRAEFAAGDMAALLGDRLYDRLMAADHRIFNLETPLTDAPSPIVKAGPNLSAPCACANGLRNLRPTALCLANNHVMDHGPQGLSSTVSGSIVTP